MHGGVIQNEWKPCASPKSSVFSLRVVVGVGIAVIPPTHSHMHRYSMNLELSPVWMDPRAVFLEVASYIEKSNHFDVYDIV